jgi:hypothetical protein
MRLFVCSSVKKQEFICSPILILIPHLSYLRILVVSFSLRFSIRLQVRDLVNGYVYAHIYKCQSLCNHEYTRTFIH